jgi:cytochrome c oxidase cbb3-type subunit I/II
MAPDMARAQAKVIADDLAAQGGGSGFETKEVTALIAYMQRLGKDIQVPGRATAATGSPSASRNAVAPAGGQP